MEKTVVAVASPTLARCVGACGNRRGRRGVKIWDVEQEVRGV